VHDHHPNALMGALAFLSAGAGAVLGERLISALVGLGMSLLGSLLYQLAQRAIRVGGDALEQRARRRLGVALAPSSTDAPGRPETSQDVPPAA